MPAINFKKEFAEKILSGQKASTIRMKAKRPIKVGDTLYLYTGLRTKNAALIRTVECKSVKDILFTDKDGYLLVCIDGQRYRQTLIYDIAVADGFNDILSFWNFFKKQYGLPFSGVLIGWGS